MNLVELNLLWSGLGGASTPDGSPVEIIQALTVEFYEIRTSTHVSSEEKGRLE